MSVYENDFTDACKNGNIKELKKCKNKGKTTIINGARQAIRKGHVNIINYLINEKKPNLNSKNFNNYNLYKLLREAIDCNNLKIFKLLESAGADVNMWGDYLFRVCYYKIDFVKYLFPKIINKNLEITRLLRDCESEEAVEFCCGKFLNKEKIDEIDKLIIGCLVDSPTAFKKYYKNEYEQDIMPYIMMTKKIKEFYMKRGICSRI